MAIKVKNIKGTSNRTCKCGSWLAHWENHTNSARANCAVTGCKNSIEVGAHVRKTDGRRDDNWWIAPFCQAHNMSNEELTIPNNTLLAPGTKKSCGS